MQNRKTKAKIHRPTFKGRFFRFKVEMSKGSRGSRGRWLRRRGAGGEDGEGREGGEGGEVGKLLPYLPCLLVSLVSRETPFVTEVESLIQNPRKMPFS